MSNVSNISITHRFNGDSSASNKVNAGQLDTQLGNLATAQNHTKAALDRITDGANNLAQHTVGFPQLKPEVAASIEASVQSAIEAMVNVYNVDDYGAEGDGVTDDTAAVQAAIAAANTGDVVKFRGSGHYKLRSLGTLTKAVIIDGGGCRVTCDVTTTSATVGSPLFCFSGSSGTSYAISPFAFFATTVTLSVVANAVNFSTGDVVELISSDSVQKWDSSGVAFVGRREISRVKSVDTGTGVITLEYPTSYAMTTSTFIRKISTVDNAVVRNFSQITEDYAGSTSSDAGLGPTYPNIVSFDYCRYAIVENVSFNGWNLQAVAIQRCDTVLVRDCDFAYPYNPGTGGHSNGVKVANSRNIRCSRLESHSVRHLVDWVACLDSESSHCVANSDLTATQQAFKLHGFESRRIRSFNDTNVGAGGWGIGNVDFAADYDVQVVNPTLYGASGGDGYINIDSGSSNVLVTNPFIYSDLLGIRIANGAGNVVIHDGMITLVGPGVGYAIKAVSSTVQPHDIDVQDVTINTNSVSYGLALEATGILRVKDCNITAFVPYYGQSQVQPDSLHIEDNILKTSWTPNGIINVGTTADFSPSRGYRIVGNTLHGSCSVAAVRCVGKSGLWLKDNRIIDDTAKVSLSGVTSVTAIVAGGGRVEGNGWASDQMACNSMVTVDMPAGATEAIRLNRAGALNWKIYSDGAGSDAFAIEDWSTGSFVDTPVYIAAGSAGSINFSRPTTTYGASALNAQLTFNMRNTAGNAQVLAFSRGNANDRWYWRMTSDAESSTANGSEMELVARDNSGTLIDSPLYIQRRANGWAKTVRPWVTAHARYKKVQSVTSSAGTYAAVQSDHIIVVTGTTTHTITLPTLPGANTSREIVIKNRSTGAVTVNRGGTDTIDGGTTFNLAANQSSILIANGTDWCRVANA